MANTYTQIYIHFVFAVDGRQRLISESYKQEIQMHTTTVIQNLGHKLFAINVMPDHVHVFVSMNPKQAIADLARAMKAISSKFINEKRWFPGKFKWQEGYGAFSYSRSQVDRVVRYIMNQEQHHREHPFREEYLDFLKKFEIEFDQEYVFEFID